MKTKLAIIIVLAAILAAGIGFLTGRHRGFVETKGKFSIVAAENFYGDIASQLGGDKVSVKSIVSNPNSDPHEYESTVEDAISIATAGIVIKNGLEYDTWMDKMLSASPNPSRIVITAGEVAPEHLPQNPHVWYGLDNIEAIANAIAGALIKADPADRAAFEKNLALFNGSLAPLRAKINEINSRYAGTPVGLTESIYLYQTQPMGLKVLTPFDFEKAVAGGNDPPAASVAEANDQIKNKLIKILIYNSQTVTPVTTNMQSDARARGIPVIPVSETMPSGKTYQSWILDEMNAVESGLSQATGH